MVTPRKGNFTRLGGHADPGYLPSVGPYVNGSRVAGFTPCLSMGEESGGVCGGYSPGRWVWWNAAAKSRVLRLEALPRSLPLGSQSCLFCVSRTHPA